MQLARLLREMASRQHGVVATWQVRDLGATGQSIRHEVRAGRWDMLSPRVLRLVGSAATDLQRATAGVLDAGRGAGLSHHSAAALWGVPGFDLRRLHTSLPFAKATRRKATLSVVHHLRVLPGNHLLRLNGVPVTSPALTVFHLAGAVHERRAERACDTLWAMGLVGAGQLQDLLDLLGGSGRNGVGVMRRLLDDRDGRYVPHESNLERRFEDLQRRARIPKLRRQVTVGGIEMIGRADFVGDGVPFVVEIVSDRYHAAPLDQERDDDRFAGMRDAGFVVLVFSEHQIWHRADEVIESLQRGWHQAEALCSPNPDAQRVIR